MLSSLRFSGMKKNKIICKQLPTDSIVESSHTADSALIIDCLTVLLMPFKHHSNTIPYVSKE